MRPVFVQRIEAIRLNALPSPGWVMSRFGIIATKVASKELVESAQTRPLFAHLLDDEVYKAGVEQLMARNDYLQIVRAAIYTADPANGEAILQAWANLARSKCPPKPATTIYETDQFRVVDHDDKGVEIQFVIAGPSGPESSSKWFTGGEAELICLDADEGVMGRWNLFVRCQVNPGNVLTLDAIDPIDSTPAPTI